MKKIQIAWQSSVAILPLASIKNLSPIAKGFFVPRSVKKTLWIVAAVIVPAWTISAKLPGRERKSGVNYSTVTLLAKFLGLSGSIFLKVEM